MKEKRMKNNSFKHSQTDFRPPNVRKRINKIKHAERNLKNNIGQRLNGVLKLAAPQSLEDFKKVKSLLSSLLSRGKLSNQDYEAIEKSRNFIRQGQQIHGV